MLLHYIDPAGDERSVATAAELAKLIRSGHISAHTLVRSDETKKWTSADTHPDCMAVSQANTPMSGEADLQKARKLRRVGWLSWIAGVAVIFVGGWLGGLSAYKTGEMFGTAIAAALLVAVYRSINLKSLSGAPPLVRAKFDAQGGAFFAAICCAIVIFNLYQQSRDRAELRNIADRFELVAEKSGPEFQVTAPQVADQSPITWGTPNDSDATRLRKLIDAAFLESQNLRSRYETAVNEAALDRWMQPSELITANGRLNARSSLAKVEVALREYRTELDASFDNMLNAPERHGFSRQMSDQIRQGMSKTMPDARAKTKMMLDLEQKSIDIMREIISFVETRTPPAEVGQGGTILFYSDSDVSRYNQLIQNLTTVVEEQTKIQQAMERTNRDNASKLREIAGS